MGSGHTVDPSPAKIQPLNLISSLSLSVAFLPLHLSLGQRERGGEHPPFTLTLEGSHV